jgi:hypothetical protein
MCLKTVGGDELTIAMPTPFVNNDEEPQPLR